ncbi:MAG TPA: hypothetical protein VL966_00780 [Alphaproteobacteria bacterium]|nr:hypothetical protein [Alphaproteobacteria bacterium]
MDIVGRNGLQVVARAAVVTAAMTALSGVAWAQFSSGPSGAGPHVGTSSSTMSPAQMSPSDMGQGAESCGPNTAACGGSSGSSGSAAKSSDEGGQNVNDLQVKARNDKIPSRRTDD